MIEKPWKTKNRGNLKLQLIVPQDILTELQQSQKDELATLISFAGAELLIPITTPLVTDGRKQLPLALEIGWEHKSMRWAASQSEAMSLNSSWGCGVSDSLFVRVRNDYPLEPISETWQRIMPNDLHTKSENTIFIPIMNELDGPSCEFGKKAWEVIANRVPDISVRLASDKPLSAIHYSDRYLRSPLALLLLRELFGSLAQHQGGIDNFTEVIVTTSYLTRNDIREANRYHHDWRDSIDRKQVFEAIMKPFGTFHFHEQSNMHLPHAREMQLTWNDGVSWTIRLDQGVGYWRAAVGSESIFPFDRSSDEQVKRLCEHDIKIEAVSRTYPTLWYVCSTTK